MRLQPRCQKQRSSTKLWRWEIYRAGRSNPVRQFFETMSEATERARWHWQNSGRSKPLNCCIGRAAMGRRIMLKPVVDVLAHARRLPSVRAVQICECRLVLVRREMTARGNLVEDIHIVIMMRCRRSVGAKHEPQFGSGRVTGQDAQDEEGMRNCSREIASCRQSLSPMSPICTLSY